MIYLIDILKEIHFDVDYLKWLRKNIDALINQQGAGCAHIGGGASSTTEKGVKQGINLEIGGTKHILISYLSMPLALLELVWDCFVLST